jgi:hypothetical protein
MYFSTVEPRRAWQRDGHWPRAGQLEETVTVFRVLLVTETRTARSFNPGTVTASRRFPGPGQSLALLANDNGVC